MLLFNNQNSYFDIKISTVKSGKFEFELSSFCCICICQLNSYVYYISNIEQLGTDLQKSIDFLLNPFFVFRNDLYERLLYYVQMLRYKNE